MGYVLASHLSFCAAGSGFVFLDRGHDRYFRLTADSEAVFDAIVRGDDVPELAQRLIRQGLLVRKAGNARPSACTAPPLPETSLAADKGGSLAGMVRAAMALVGVRRQLRRIGWSRAIEATCADRATRPCTDVDVDRLSAIVAAFRSLGLWTTAFDACVPQSLALFRLCRQSGQQATIVIGAKLDPFAAHCWVQAGPYLLNERVETVRAFTPIWVP